MEIHEEELTEYERYKQTNIIIHYFMMRSSGMAISLQENVKLFRMIFLFILISATQFQCFMVLGSCGGVQPCNQFFTISQKVCVGGGRSLYFFVLYWIRRRRCQWSIKSLTFKEFLSSVWCHLGYLIFVVRTQQINFFDSLNLYSLFYYIKHLLSFFKAAAKRKR